MNRLLFWFVASCLAAVQAETQSQWRLIAYRPADYASQRASHASSHAEVAIACTH